MTTPRDENTVPHDWLTDTTHGSPALQADRPMETVENRRPSNMHANPPAWFTRTRHGGTAEEEKRETG